MKKIVAGVLLATISIGVMAVPAKRGPITRIAEDGTEQVVYLHGDEHLHYMTNAQGEWLEEQTLKPMSAEAKALRLQAGEARMAKVRKAQAERAKIRQAQLTTGIDRLLSPRGAVILVSYSDKDFSATHDEMVDWAMGEDYTYNGATGSINRYFLDQSWGEYDLQIDVYGPVKVSKTLAYYGANDIQGNDKHPDELVKEACILAHDSLGADFSQYDFDNDGNVDWVVILYAGYGEASGASANTIWPHQYELSYTGMSFMLDGKTVDHYCCLNELTGRSGKTRDGIGTFCHEFSHVMGLPDFYPTIQGATQHTLCNWDIMDYGPYNNEGNTPPCYSAYERWFMGWVTPRVLTVPEEVTLRPLNDSQEALLMCEGDVHNLDGIRPNPQTFYLMENRTQTGWDKYLPGKGMLITKIQYSYNKWAQNTVNNTANKMGVDIMEAKANSSAYGKATDAYPRGAGSFTKFADHEITEILLEENNDITFLYRGDAMGVDVVKDERAARKHIEDGRVIIVRDGQKFDILGNRL